MMNLLNQIAQNKNIKKPVIYGFESLELTDAEKDFFSKASPIGFILFKRNIKDKKQLKSLTNSLKTLMNGEVLILVDQEGGRVARLQGDDWQKYPPAQCFADLYQNNQEQARKECYNNSALIAKDLAEVGINVNCAPVLDIATSKTHEIIGDRAFGRNAAQIIDLASRSCQAFLNNQIYPVIKHIPGHGRAIADSHLELPIIDDDLLKLQNSDFVPFKKLSNMKFAMTAHILYSKIDPDLPATISKKAIDLIRNEIGFKNILMSDDLSMKALPGSFAYRTKAALKAGCDLILHCNGNMDEMIEINNNLPFINDNLTEKLYD